MFGNIVTNPLLGKIHSHPLQHKGQAGGVRHRDLPPREGQDHLPAGGREELPHLLPDDAGEKFESYTL